MTTLSKSRLTEVVSTLMMEGLHVPMARMRVSHCATWSCRAHCTWARWTGRRVSDHPWPVAVRTALVKLGPAFVKIGQILSVRTDLVPPELAQELHSLQSDVPPVPFAEVRSAVEASLGATLEQAFTSFEPEPLAAGSVAQVHRAVLAGGVEVAVKVKRPGIDALVATDLEILVWLAEHLERYLPAARPYRPAHAAAELRRYTLQELDFRNEASVAREVGVHFETWPTVRVPRIYRATRDVIVMEFVDSFPIDDLGALQEHGIDLDVLVRTGLDSVLAQIFDFGLFHADPHPGNLHVTAEGDIVLLDYGIFGRVDDAMKRDCAMLMWTLARGDTELASYYLLRMADVSPDADVRAFRDGVEARYRAWRGRSVSEYGFARLVYEEFTIGARNGVVFPADMVLLGKAMVTIEGVVLAIDPTMDLSRAAQPYLDRLRQRLFSGDDLLKGFERALPLWFDLVRRLPVGLAMGVEHRVWPERAPPPPSRAPDPRRPLFGPVAALSGAALVASALPPTLGGWSIVGAALLLIGLGATVWQR